MRQRYLYEVGLIDGQRLADLMINFEIGLTRAETYQVNRVDQDFFDEA